MPMSRFARTAVLATAFAGLSLGATALSTAQDKSPSKGSGKKAAGRIEVGAGKDDKFRFFVYSDADDKLIAMSGPGGFATKAEAEKAVDDLRAILNSTTKILPHKGKEKDKDDDKDEPKAKKSGKDKDKDEVEKDDAPKPKKKPE